MYSVDVTVRDEGGRPEQREKLTPSEVVDGVSDNPASRSGAGEVSQS